MAKAALHSNNMKIHFPRMSLQVKATSETKTKVRPDCNRKLHAVRAPGTLKKYTLMRIHADVATKCKCTIDLFNNISLPSLQSKEQAILLKGPRRRLSEISFGRECRNYLCRLPQFASAVQTNKIIRLDQQQQLGVSF